MTLRLELSQETARLIEEGAMEHGVPREEYAIQLLESRLAERTRPKPFLSDPEIPPEERLRRFKEWIALPRPPMPVLPPEALERESIYEGR